MTVRHIILWTLKKEGRTSDEIAEIKSGIKRGLEGLSGKIPGLLAIHVQTEGLPSSTADLMLDSAFSDAEALRGYALHPAHTAVANEKVRPFTAARACLDFEDTRGS